MHIGFHMSHTFTLCMKSDVGILLITIYVDDLIIVGDSETQIEHVKGLLKKEIKMKDLGELLAYSPLEQRLAQLLPALENARQGVVTEQH